MAQRRPRSTVPPLRFDWSFWTIIVIAALWLAYNYWNDGSSKPASVPEARKPIQVERVDTPDTLSETPGIGYPKPVEGQQIVRHTAYTLSYSEDAEQPSWVAYTLSAANFKGKFSRDEADASFEADPDIATGSATPEDYKRSGYDRGHMAPAGDMKFNRKTYEECFYMSNMSPQDHGLNTGLWRRIEETVRRWQKRDEYLYVVTGPVLKPGLPTIGKDKVAIPEEYYKVVLDLRAPQIKMIGFLVPNKDSDLSMEKFCVSVDKIERETGLDFFQQLPDELEDRLEAGNDIKGWFTR